MPPANLLATYKGRARVSNVWMVLSVGGHRARPRHAGADPGLAVPEGLLQPQRRRCSPEMTPPPGSAGGLLNAIVGSPDDDRARRAASARRSASWPAPTWPSTATTAARQRRALRQRHPAAARRPSSSACSSTTSLVAPIGHFSGIAGGLALAVIVMPVVLRTTEDMLRLVPDRAARGRLRARHAALAGDPPGRLLRREARAWSPACCWPWPASAARPRRCCSRR